MKCKYLKCFVICTYPGSWMVSRTKPHTLFLVRTHSLFDPAVFTRILSPVTLLLPNSNTSLSQNRYLYRCPTHGGGGGATPRTVQSKVREQTPFKSSWNKVIWQLESQDGTACRCWSELVLAQYFFKHLLLHHRGTLLENTEGSDDCWLEQ